MLILGQEIAHVGESSAEIQRDPNKTDGGPARTVAGCRHTNRVGEWSTMDEEQQTAAVAEAQAEAPTEAVPAPATDIAQDDQVLIVGSTFSASMTPEVFARVLRESDRLAAEHK